MTSHEQEQSVTQLRPCIETRRLILMSFLDMLMVIAVHEEGKTKELLSSYETLEAKIQNLVCQCGFIDKLFGRQKVLVKKLTHIRNVISNIKSRGLVGKAKPLSGCILNAHLGDTTTDVPMLHEDFETLLDRIAEVYKLYGVDPYSQPTWGNKYWRAGADGSLYSSTVYKREQDLLFLYELYERHHSLIVR